MRDWERRAGVAAGHPATAEGAISILKGGGTAADAAVAASLVSCVAETVMSGIAGGGHAIWWDAASREARLLDFFVAVPGLGQRREASAPTELEIAFGEQPVPYNVGIATCAVPGVPAGLEELWRRHGVLPWSRLLEPALMAARNWVAMPPTPRRVDCSPRANCLPSPASCTPSSCSRRRVPAASIAAPSLGPCSTSCRSEAGSSPQRTSRLTVRCGTSRFRATTRAAVSPPGRGWQALSVRSVGCVVTTSLGLGSGDWLPGLDVHLNSMLGETELVVGPLEPGGRMQSMMAPTVAVDGDGLVLAIGSAGGSRLRSALVQVLAGVLEEGLAPAEAVARPRLHPSDGVVHAEAGIPEEALAALESRGLDVRRWPALHHYFGGASAVGRAGVGADPRCSGLALTLGT